MALAAKGLSGWWWLIIAIPRVQWALAPPRTWNPADHLNTWRRPARKFCQGGVRIVKLGEPCSAWHYSSLNVAEQQMTILQMPSLRICADRDLWARRQHHRDQADRRWGAHFPLQECLGGPTQPLLIMPKKGSAQPLCIPMCFGDPIPRLGSNICYLLPYNLCKTSWHQVTVSPFRHLVAGSHKGCWVLSTSPNWHKGQ